MELTIHQIYQHVTRRLADIYFLDKCANTTSDTTELATILTALDILLDSDTVLSYNQDLTS
jgi:hypothetical protein